MNNSQSTSNLELLDIFKLLHLEGLSDEEKIAYVAKLTSLVLTDMVAVDLPQVMTQEEIDQFNKLTDSEGTKDQAITLLKTKIPNFEEMLRTRMLELKKDLARSSFEERLAINEGSEAVDKAEKKVNLEKTLAAIDTDDWATVDSLITAYPQPKTS